MDVLSLSAQLTLDTSDYEQGLQRAEETMAQAGRQIRAAVSESSQALSALNTRLQEITSSLHAAERAAQRLTGVLRGLHSALPGRISL